MKSAIVSLNAEAHLSDTSKACLGEESRHKLPANAQATMPRRDSNTKLRNLAGHVTKRMVEIVPEAKPCGAQKFRISFGYDRDVAVSSPIGQQLAQLRGR